MGHQGVGFQGLLSSPSLSQKPWNHDYDAGDDSAFLHLTFLVLKVGVMMLTPGVLVRIQGGLGRAWEMLQMIHIPLVTKPVASWAFSRTWGEGGAGSRGLF